MTHTFALLELNPVAYEEITDKLKKAGYDHVFSGEPNGAIDMHGIGVASDLSDTITIYGVKYHLGLFRELGLGYAARSRLQSPCRDITANPTQGTNMTPEQMQKEVDKVIKLCAKDSNQVDHKQLLRAVLFQNEIARLKSEPAEQIVP